MLTANELRQKYLDFFKSKGHAIIPSASLIPENDPSTLFAGSGMQAMVPYLLGEKHPLGTRIADSQKCFRSQDIESVGDNRHTTFFEMLGNWSLGDYFKTEQIDWMFEFLTQELKLNPASLYISVFRGLPKKGIERDTEAAELWQKKFASVGLDAPIVDNAETNGLQGGKIFYYSEDQNWWSRSGVTDNMPIGEPGGPDSEIYWDFGAQLQIHENSEFKDQPCHPACDCGRFLEIGNNVFMQYTKTEKGFQPLPKKNIDFGGGLERLLAAVINTPDIFKTSAFFSIIEKIEKISNKTYAGNEKAFRIIADHLKAASMILGDEKGITPSNTGAGYVLRRLIRRAVRYGRLLKIKDVFTFKIAELVIEMYKNAYPEVKKNKDFIINQLVLEEEKFAKTIEEGLKEFNKWYQKPKIYWSEEDEEKQKEQEKNILQKLKTESPKIMPGFVAFRLFSTYGFPLELIIEEAKNRGLEVDIKNFNKEMEKHQELSRTASAGMFKGGLADTSEQTTKLHTAAHLMLAALRQVLGPDVYQKGSNITPERLRFDFSYGQKMTPEQIKQVENIVNEQITKNLPIISQEMPTNEAIKQGAMGIFGHKYGDKVKVYSIGDFSKEICGGPHVTNTGKLGRFKIIKEESSSAGVRRIKAILE
ncbi:MAG TPA: alanine--tRNA ligase [Candidatus Uhrbacteria bacterium]|nr:alanine--tRNA ligase [Candidatus Uhrbacteria bacterium]